jgi:hypothetical protein
MSRTFAILLALLILGLTSLALGQEPSAAEERVLLRYKLDAGDAQVFDSDARLTMRIKASQNGTTQNVSTVMAFTVPFSIQGTGVNDDGTMNAEVRFHGFDADMTMTTGGQTVHFTADMDGIEVTQNGTRVMAGSWGSSEMGQFPDMRRLLDTAMQVRFNDHGELVEMSNSDALGAQFQGFDFEQAINNQVVYPEQAVGVGDTWQHELTQEFANAALPGGKMSIRGKATYTVLERATYRNRDCFKLGVNAAFDAPEAPRGLKFDQTVAGTAYVDLATGVPLDCRLSITQRFSGTTQGVDFDLGGNGTITMSYAGGKQKLAELLRTADTATDTLRQLLVPMVTERAIKINDALYEKGQTVTIDGEDYSVVAFKATALKLHRLSDSAVYQLGLNSEGHVTYVKLLGHAD